MKKVWIEPGCISCGTCEFVAPEVFKVTDVSHIQENAPIEKCAEAIKEAARLCPVSVIKFEE
jgi:ferredoxin